MIIMINTIIMLRLQLSLETLSHSLYIEIKRALLYIINIYFLIVNTFLLVLNMRYWLTLSNDI